VTHENNENDLHENPNDKRVPATLTQRFLAFFIDRLLCFLFLFNLSYFIPTDSYYFFSIIRLCEQMIPTVIIYHVLFELCWNGQTPGKKICRIRIVKENYEPLNIEAVFTRNFLRFCDVLPAFYITGIFSFIYTKRKQRLGDICAKTLVVCEESINDEININQTFTDKDSGFSSNPTENIYEQKD
jgi:uncharacterized RDD family membrane protein YckC